MKKMCCEVCGSNEIKKVDNDIFQCQSCGTQYGKEEAKKLLIEVSGTVTIDHSEDIENALKRAEQYFADGDYETAEDYYNKVLDLQPDNKIALDKVDKINKEKAKPTNIYFLEKNITSEKAFEIFLETLKDKPNIAPDIYKELSIISIHNEYFPFEVLYGKYNGNYSGTACFKKEVPYLTEEVVEKWVNGERKKVRQLVEKTRIEIDKKPASGEFSTNVRNIYSISSSFNGLFCDVTPGRFDKKVESDLDDISSVKCALLAAIEEYIDDKYDKFSQTTKLVDVDNVSTDIPLNLTSDTSAWQKRAKKQYDTYKESVCHNHARRLVGGDYSEYVNFSCKLNFEYSKIVYVPIQIIEYAYKGDFYYAVSILNNKCNDINTTYPYYKKTDDTIREGDMKINEASHKGYYGVFAWFLAALCGGVGYIFNMSVGGFVSALLLFLAALCAVVGMITTIVGLIQLSNARKIKNEYLKIIEEYENNKKNELNREFKLFFKNYTNPDSIPNCNDIISQSTTFSCQPDEISYRLLEDSCYYDDEEDEDDNEMYDDDDE